MVKKIAGSFLFILVLFISISKYKTVLAQANEDFKADYSVEYQLKDSGSALKTAVSFKISITNLRSDVYVKKFTISFPKNFNISNLTASDDNGAITPTITVDQEKTRVDMEFTNPVTGKNSVNNFTLHFNQDNLFKINGNIWEVIIPTVKSKQPDTIYKVVVDLPPETKRKISISKPKPDLVLNLPDDNQITWNNVQTKTIYAVFGDKQYYRADLTYHIKNPNIYPVLTEVAFPPDTLYQKVYLNSISPKPTSVYTDRDGNFMGKYILAPSEIKTVNYSAVIEEDVLPRQDMLALSRSQIVNQKDYLLTAQKYWEITKNLDKIKKIKTPSDDYYFVTSDLQYNFDKLVGSNARLGAEEVLSQPNNAVCLEFTDLFIAIARENGILSREIEGYGFSQDQSFRPISLNGDILHSWPEYYSSEANLWIPVDPTWENTSGIDYYKSFDLNHITFAIHGVSSTYPLPAGTYKTGSSRDVLITPASTVPSEAIRISLNNLTYSNKINTKTKNPLSFLVRNDGNTTLINLPVQIEGTGIEFANPNITVPELPPYGESTVKTQYTAISSQNIQTANFSLKIAGQKLFTGNVSIYSFNYDLAIQITEYVLGAFVILLIFKFIFRKKNKRG